MLTEHVLVDGFMKEVPDMPILILGCVVMAFIFSAIYGRWGSGSYGAGSGLTFGILVGIMLGVGEGLIDYATSNLMNMTGMMINAVIYIVHTAILGLLAGLVYGKMG